MVLILLRILRLYIEECRMQTNPIKLVNGVNKQPNPPEQPPVENPTGIPEEPIKKSPPVEEPPESEPDIQDPPPQPIKPDIVES